MLLRVWSRVVALTACETRDFVQRWPRKALQLHQVGGKTCARNTSTTMLRNLLLQVRARPFQTSLRSPQPPRLTPCILPRFQAVVCDCPASSRLGPLESDVAASTRVSKLKRLTLSRTAYMNFWLADCSFPRVNAHLHCKTGLPLTLTSFAAATSAASPARLIQAGWQTTRSFVWPCTFCTVAGLPPRFADPVRPLMSFPMSAVAASSARTEGLPRERASNVDRTIASNSGAYVSQEPSIYDQKQRTDNA